MITMADGFCQTTVQKKEECKCYWHKRLENELGKYLSEESWKKHGRKRAKASHLQNNQTLEANVGRGIRAPNH